MYSRASELFKDCLDSIGLDSSLYGLHSLRRGGATAVYANAKSKVRDGLVRNHGRWKSDLIKDGYVDNSLRDKLRVTEGLGI